MSDARENKWLNEKGLVALAYTALASTQVVMAMWNVVGSKLVNHDVDLPLIVFVTGRQLVASVLLGVAAAIKHGPDCVMVQRKHIRATVASSIMGQYMSPIFYLYGLQAVSATLASIFDGPLVPIIAYVIALCVGAEALPTLMIERKIVLSAMFLATSGAALLIFSLGDSSGDGTEDGDEYVSTGSSKLYVLALAALFIEAASLSTSIVIQKPLTIVYPLLSYSFRSCLGGFIMAAIHVSLWVPGGFVTNMLLLVNACIESWHFRTALLMSSVGNSLLNTLFTAVANSRLPSSTVALGACLQPIFTLILEVLLTDATFTAVELFSFVVIAVGMYMFTQRRDPFGLLIA